MYSQKKRLKINNDDDLESNQSEQSEEDDNSENINNSKKINSDSNDSDNVDDSDKDLSSDDEKSIKKKISIKKNDSDNFDFSANSNHSSEKSDNDNSENEKNSDHSLEKSDESDKENSDNEKSSEHSFVKSDNSDNENNSNDESSVKKLYVKDSDAKDTNIKALSSSDDEIVTTKNDKLKNIFDSEEESDKEQNENKKEKKNIDEIFGDFSSEDENENESKQKAIEEKENQENRLVFASEDEDDDDDVIPETRIDVTIPRIVADLGKEIHFIKLPNFLSVDTHPYDPSWYEDEIDEDEICDEEGRARMKLKVENTIRWRNVLDKDNKMVKESNARIVKWSDGSMSLHLGSEIFDITKQHLLHGDNNHLYVRQGTGLQGQAVFKTKLTFRPHSTDSFTHKKMTLSLADRSLKTQKIRVLPTVGLDPEANRNEMIKKEEDKLRASIRRENKARRVRERINQRGPTASYLEPDIDEDDDGAISLSAIKNKYKKGNQNFADVYSDSESDNSDDNIFNKKKISVKKTRIEESDNDE